MICLNPNPSHHQEEMERLKGELTRLSVDPEQAAMYGSRCAVLRARIAQEGRRVRGEENCCCKAAP